MKLATIFILPFFRQALALLVLATGLIWLSGQAVAQDASERSGKCKSTDLVFVIDDTFSLKGAIYDMKVESERLLDLLDQVSNGDFQVGLVTFKDFVEVDEDLNAAPSPAEKKERIRRIIRSLSASAGAAGPEASDEALRTVIFGMPAEGRQQTGDFRGKFTGRTKIIVLITDNLPGGFDDTFKNGVDDRSAADMADAAYRREILISSIYVPTSFYGLIPQVEDIMRDYALITGGLFAKVQASGKGTADAIATIIDTCGRRPMV